MCNMRMILIMSSVGILERPDTAMEYRMLQRDNT